MKIIYCTHIQYPTERAHGIQITHMCNALTKYAQVELIAARKGVGNAKYGSVHFVVKTLGLESLLWLQKISVKVWFFLSSRLYRYRLDKYVKHTDHQDTLVFTRDYNLVATLKKSTNNIILEVHDMPSYPQRIIDAIDQVTLCVVISDGLKEVLIQHGADIKKILVAYDAVDISAFVSQSSIKETLRSLYKIPATSTLVLYTGQLIKWKGVHTVLEAIKKIDSQKFHCVVIGGSDKDIALYRRTYKGVKNIHVHGRVSHANIPVYTAQADILVLPNSAKQKISSIYTSPLKLFEYMAAKKPIIASDLPSLRNMLNNKNAFFAKPDNIESWRQALISVSQDPYKAKSKAMEAYNDVQHYTWSNRAATIIDAYERKISTSDHAD